MTPESVPAAARSASELVAAEAIDVSSKLTSKVPVRIAVRRQLFNDFS